MSITDELRRVAANTEEANGRCGKLYRGDLDHIADRIDAEVADMQAFCDRLREAAESREDVTLWGVDYVALPVDADGVPIYAGDMLDGYGKTIEVVEIRHGRSGWVLISRDGNGYADTFAFTHHHPPTVEDVLEEMLREYDRDDTELTNGEIIERFAAKLRLRGEGE